MRVQRARQNGVGRGRGGRLRYYDDVETGEHRLMHAERFSDLALDAVARNSLAGYPPCDDHAETSAAGAGGSGNHEESVAHSMVPTLDGGELRRAAQPPRARQTKAPARMSYTLSRARPLARRELITARPPTVRIRARKPCVRLRLSTLGW